MVVVVVVKRVTLVLVVSRTVECIVLVSVEELGVNVSDVDCNVVCLEVDVG